MAELLGAAAVVAHVIILPEPFEVGGRLAKLVNQSGSMRGGAGASYIRSEHAHQKRATLSQSN